MRDGSKVRGTLFVILIFLCMIAAPIIRAWVYDWDWRCVIAECRVEKR